MELEGKVAIVTGASRGIGKAIALALGRAGADVVVMARSTRAQPHRLFPGTIEETAEALQALGRRVLPIQMDITRDEQVEAMARRTLEVFGHVDILVNNVATLIMNVNLVDTTMRRWDLIFNVNLRGMVLVTKLFLPGIIERRQGSIINVSQRNARMFGGYGLERPSLARRPRTEGAGSISYHASKAGVERLTLGLAEELKPHNIAVNCLAPSTEIATEATDLVLGADSPDRPDWDPPASLGPPAVFLAQQDARFTGHILDPIGFYRREWPQPHD